MSSRSVDARADDAILQRISSLGELSPAEALAWVEKLMRSLEALRIQCVKTVADETYVRLSIELNVALIDAKLGWLRRLRDRLVEDSSTTEDPGRPSHLN
jgi:hypothetical protein